MCTATLLDVEMQFLDPVINYPVKIILDFVTLWLNEVDQRRQIEEDG